MIEGSRANAKALKDSLWRAERGRKATQRQMGQKGKFGERENPVGLANGDIEFVPICFA